MPVGSFSVTPYLQRPTHLIEDQRDDIRPHHRDDQGFHGPSAAGMDGSWADGNLGDARLSCRTGHRIRCGLSDGRFAVRNPHGTWSPDFRSLYGGTQRYPDDAYPAPQGGGILRSLHGQFRTPASRRRERRASDGDRRSPVYFRDVVPHQVFRESTRRHFLFRRRGHVDRRAAYSIGTGLFPSRGATPGCGAAWRLRAPARRSRCGTVPRSRGSSTSRPPRITLRMPAGSGAFRRLRSSAGSGARRGS